MKKTVFIMAVCAMAFAGTGCSVIRPDKSKSANTVSGASATRVEKNGPAVSAPAAIPAPAAVPGSVPAHTAGQPDAAKAEVAAITMLTPLARNLGGQWSIIQVGATVIDRDENMPYITFVPGSAAFYANNGCNTLNGSYSVNGKDEITFHNVLTTMRYCADVKFDSMINTIIADGVTTRLRMSEVGQESFVDFIGEGGKQLMRLRRGNLEFLNGRWTVESITGLDKLEVPADIFFDLAELKLHGNTGCNFVNGEIYLDHRRSNAVDFSRMGTTRMACPYTSQETAMLVALEQAASAISDGNDRVMLLDFDGKKLMTLKRAPVNPDE